MQAISQAQSQAQPQPQPQPQLRSVIGPIPLEKRRTPIDLTKWDERCLRVLGRRLKFGDKLSPKELYVLGFVHAANSEEVYADYVQRSLSNQNSLGPKNNP